MNVTTAINKLYRLQVLPIGKSVAQIEVLNHNSDLIKQKSALFFYLYSDRNFQEFIYIIYIF